MDKRRDDGTPNKKPVKKKTFQSGKKITNSDILSAIQHVNDRVDGVHTRMDEMNGRMDVMNSNLLEMQQNVSKSFESQGVIEGKIDNHLSNHVKVISRRKLMLGWALKITSVLLGSGGVLSLIIWLLGMI